jgi:hypothetical protein
VRGFIWQAPLSILIARYVQLIIGGENIPFFSTISVENISFNGFFLTVATGRSFCESSEPLFVTDA